jgi:1-acyl-sn-glycerol-3-phosphate acyltransferase
VQSLRAIVALACFLVLTLALLPIQFLLVRATSRPARRLARSYWRAVARIMPLGIAVKGHPPDRGPALLVANHISWFDVVALGAVVEAAFIAKSEVGGWPLIGLVARAGRTLFIDRSERADAARAVAAMRARFAAGDMLVLFGEGTSSDGRRILTFRSPLLAAAAGPAEHPVKVIPVSISALRLGGLPLCRRTMPKVAWYGDMALAGHLWEVLKRGPVDIEIRFHDPIASDRLADRKQLARCCETVVRAGRQEAFAGMRRETTSCPALPPRLMAFRRTSRGIA